MLHGEHGWSGRSVMDTQVAVSQQRPKLKPPRMKIGLPHYLLQRPVRASGLMCVRTRMEWLMSLSCVLAEADGFNAAGKANVDSKIAEAPQRNKKKEQVRHCCLPSV
jgi:hypothetical protein